MKIKSLILTAILLLTAFQASAQFGVGMRDTRFIFGDFTFLRHYEVKLEHSIFSENIAFQYLRGYASYKGDWKDLEYKGSLYFGSAYNRDYYSGGALLAARYTFFRRLIVDGKFNPHYDSGYGYKTCFYGGLGAVITKNIDVLAGYTNIPEYRKAENRIHFGFDFHVGRLSVSPALSIATQGPTNVKTMRVLAAFRYQF